MSKTRIALIGDYSSAVTAHVAIPPALELAAKALDVEIDPVWIHTSRLTSKEELRALSGYQGIWCVPASPYANTEGAIAAISFARTEGIPFLGTCGGFQHAVIEYFRNVIGTADAAHAELNPEAEHPLISKLSCSLVEVSGTIRLTPGSLAQRLYGTDRVEEGYRCSYGLNPDFAQSVRDRDDLRIEGTDEAGDIRIVRLPRHPFFLATLFQPERSSIKGRVHPLIREFVSASAGRR
ncbi:MAG TPA: CTP synthase [Bryobacteraceae bacterium]|jgi:CTP synthase (UTP-ammonia lyase)|nr:CTP synthase [Bryobacteraceae bacterium]